MSETITLDEPPVQAEPEQAPNRWLAGHVPGEPGIWIFVMGDMLVFAVFFCVFLVARIDQHDVFAHSRTQLNQTIGFVNTVWLLSSSLCVALGVRSLRSGARAAAGRLFTAGWLCGAAFVAFKALEYGEKLHHGLNPGTNDFFMYFFILTGVHLFHVLIGLSVLAWLRHVARRPEARQHDLRTVESGASFWHMVDLLWVVLFPLLYLSS